MRDIKVRFWNQTTDISKSRYFYDINEVMECLKQQMLHNAGMPLGYNHEGDGSRFEWFTGLLDKNGKEIYEGDIIQATYLKIVGRYGKAVDANASGIVEFIDGQFCIYTNTTKEGQKHYKYFSQLWPVKDGYDCEIIGNRHDNPELLSDET